MALLASANLLMNIVRTPPAEASKNWRDWLEKVRGTKFPELFDAIIRSRLWSVINAVGLVAGLVTFFYPTFWQDAVRSPRQLPGFVQQQTTPQTKAAPAEPRSAEDMATELSIWDSVQTRNVPVVGSALNALENSFSRWPSMLDTAQARETLRSDLVNSDGIYDRASEDVEVLRRLYPMYPDVAAGLHQPRRSDLRKAVIEFAEQDRPTEGPFAERCAIRASSTGGRRPAGTRSFPKVGAKSAHVVGDETE